MGRRICFLKTNDNSSLEELFSQHAVNFRDWLLKDHATSVAEFGEQLCSENLAAYLVNTSIPDIRQVEKSIADEMTIAFIGDYCDRAPAGQNLTEIIGPLMNARTYEPGSKQVSATRDEQFIQLWNYIMYGRSLVDNAYLAYQFDDFYTAFLNASDRTQLITFIETYFPASKEVGFICVLEALSEMQDNNGDLIVGIG